MPPPGLSRGSLHFGRDLGHRSQKSDEKGEGRAVSVPYRRKRGMFSLVYYLLEWDDSETEIQQNFPFFN